MLFVENYFWLNDLKLVRIAVSLFLRIVIINQDYREKKSCSLKQFWPKVHLQLPTYMYYL